MRDAGLPSAYFVDLVRLIIIYTKVATGILMQSIALEGSWSWIWVEREKNLPTSSVPGILGGEVFGLAGVAYWI